MHDSDKEGSDTPFVVSVVLTWNDTELTTKCLSSIFDNDYTNLKVILVDNGSSPQRGPELKSSFPAIELIQLEVNQGFSGGANRGLERALELGADYVHLIGNDATLAPNAITRLVEEFESRPDTGAASPLLLDPGEPKMVQFFRATLDRETARHFHHEIGKPYDPDNFAVVESDFIPMVTLIFRASALREVGLLDESFGTCWEDFDLCLRFHDAGWKYITVGDATAVHIGSYTTGRASPYIVYYTIRNRFECLKRYAQPGYWHRNWNVLIRSIWLQMKEYGLTNWRCHWALVRGFVDYLFKVRGERTVSNASKIPGQV